MRRAFLFSIVLSIVSLPAGDAFAQSDAEIKATAEAIFREGMDAFNAGKLDVACPKLESAVALTRGEALGGALLLAKCYEKQGKTASAWAVYSEVAGKARASDQKARADEAETGAATLLPKLHYVTLNVPAEITAIEGASILRQGKPLRREVWSVRFPTNPGTIEFEATAPGKRRAKVIVQIPDTPGETPVIFAPLEDETGALPGLPPTANSSGSKEPIPSPASTRFWTGPHIAGAALAIGGVFGMGAGIGIGRVAKGRYDDAIADTSNCSPLPAGGHTCTDITKTEDARSLGNVGTIVFFVGAGAAIGGGLLLVLTPSQAKAAANLPLPMAWQGGGGLVWKGIF